MRKATRLLGLAFIGLVLGCPPSGKQSKGSGQGTGTTGSVQPGTASGQRPTKPDPGQTRHALPLRPRRTPRAVDAPPVEKKAFASEGKPTKRGSFGGLRSAMLRKIAATYPAREQRPVAAPLSLTASDGTGLELVSMKAAAVLEGPLAFTELHLVFKNPRPQIIEGRFAITLPPKAAISRLAMKLPHGWMEAEVVERQAARRIYEDFLHRRQDPALLEKKAGNEFRARIFPIPANGEKEIKISFSQQLEGATTPYRLPLVGLPQMRQLSIRAFLSKAEKQAATTSLGGVTLTQQVVKVEKENYKPDRDFVVQQPAGAPAGLRYEALAVARIAPLGQGGVKAQPIAGLVVLVDSSASRAAGYASQIERLGVLLRELRTAQGEAVKLQVAAFDQTIGRVYEGTLGGFGKAQLDKLLSRRALGASDLHGALRWAATLKGYDRLLLVSDGVATAGKTQPDALRAAVRELKPAFSRLDVLLVGGIRDEELAEKLARGNLAQDGLLLDDTKPEAELARRIGLSTLSGIEVEVPGAQWVWPSRLDGLQPGDEVLVYADLSGGQVALGKPLAVKLTGKLKQTLSVPLAPVKGPLLERAWVNARIARLGHQRDAASGDRDMQEAIDKQIVALSIKHRVLCDKTALLVLETEWDYQRYHIDRRSLSDILTVGASGIEVLKRSQPTLRTPTPRRRMQNSDPATGRVARGKRKAAKDESSAPRLAAAAPAKTQGLGPLGGKGSGATGGAPAGVRGGERAKRVNMRRFKTIQVIRGVSASADGKATAASAPPSAKPRPQVASVPRPKPSPRRRAGAAAAPPPAGLSGLSDSTLVRTPRPARTNRPRRRPRRVRRPPRRDGFAAAVRREKKAALTGRFAVVMSDLERGRREAAVQKALAWRNEMPGDVLALVALGESLAKLGELELAARAYGSLIDLFPSRADLRRFAGQRLETLGKIAQALAADTYAEAVLQRPDHPNSHRMLAWALVRLGRYEDAFVAISKGARRRYPSGRFRGVEQILREDQALIAAAWYRAEPNRKAEIDKLLAVAGVRPDKKPSLRFILSWETDANDVDFHIYDGRGGHAYYSQRDLPSGGELYADVTTGYGPECFTIPGKARAFPYKLQIHYFRRGPMGYGMGRLQVIQHDGQGGLKFEQRPFVVMVDSAYVDLGMVRRPLR